MAEPKHIRRANLILRELDAVYPQGDGVHPCFQLRFSDDLSSIVPVYTELAGGQVEPVMEYRCKCGVDRQVHAPWCNGLEIAKVKMQKVSSFGMEGEFSSYPKSCWVLCRWLPPISLDRWKSVMGTDEDHPAQGRYVPVHRGLQCVVIPPSAPPEDYVPAARAIVRVWREHAATWREKFAKNQELKRQKLQVPVEDGYGNMIADAPAASAYHGILDRIKENGPRFHEEHVGYTPEIKESECLQP